MRTYIIAAILAGVIIVATLIAGCGRKQYSTFATNNTQEEAEGETPNQGSDDSSHSKDSGLIVQKNESYMPGELICNVETEEEAEEIAKLYGIELRSCSYGVAVFFAGEDADIFAIIEEGNKNGYPPLSPNYIITLDDGDNAVSLD